MLGLKRAEVLRKFSSIAEFAGIGDYMDQPVKHYSMGMRTRLAFSICAHVEAEILVVDEALSVGDAAFQRKCLDWIDNFRKTGTLLFVSHSMAEVRRLCTRAIWIEEGRIREQGDPNDVIRSYHRALLVEKDDVHRFSARAREMIAWTPAPLSWLGLGWWSFGFGGPVGERGAGARASAERCRAAIGRPISASWRR